MLTCLLHPLTRLLSPLFCNLLRLLKLRSTLLQTIVQIGDLLLILRTNSIDVGFRPLAIIVGIRTNSIDVGFRPLAIIVGLLPNLLGSFLRFFKLRLRLV